MQGVILSLSSIVNFINHLLFLTHRMSLNKMVAQQFPLRSTEFPAGSSMYQEYTAAVDKVRSGWGGGGEWEG